MLYADVRPSCPSKLIGASLSKHLLIRRLLLCDLGLFALAYAVELAGDGFILLRVLERVAQHGFGLLLVL